jgi:DNA-binding winged helix-turn-helix (wHTH) protein/tetratricopeptide (TPR) repeat protein
MRSIEYRFGDFRLLPASRELWRGADAVVAPRRVFDCLAYLIEHRDRAVGRDELVAAVWGRVDVSDVQLGQIVVRARRAVDDDGVAQQRIRTIQGFGYRWIAETEVGEVSRLEPPVPPPSTAPSAEPAAAVPVAEAAAAAADQPSTTARPRPVRRVLAAVAVALVLLALGAAWWLRRDGAPALFDPAAAATALVLPLEAGARSSEGWVRLGGMDLIADRLRSGGLAVPTSESVLAVLQSAGEDRKAQTQALQRAFGVRWIVRGTASHGDGGWRFVLSAEAADGAVVSAEGQREDAVAAARAAADTLLAALGHVAPGDAAGDGSAQEAWRRARAALLANQNAAAREILSQSPALARMPLERAYRLAQVDHRDGRYDRAAAGLSAVLAELGPGGDALLRTRVLIARGAASARRGDFAAALADYDAALAAAPAEGAVLERGQALSGRGSSLVPAHRYADALAAMGEARAHLAAAGDRFGTARVDANLGMLELYRGRPGAALEYLDSAADQLQALGALHEWQITVTGLVQARLALLQHAEAQAAADRGWAVRERMTEPDQIVDITLNRAQVLLAAGDLRGAERLLADPLIDRAVNPVLATRALALQADLAWQAGRWQSAARLSERALASWPPSGADGERDFVALIAQRALLAAGERERAAAVFDRAAAAPAAAAEPMPGQVPQRLARAEWRQALGDTAAGEDFRAALQLAERGGVPADLALVASSYVPYLLEHGDLDGARAVAGRVAPWAERDFDCALVQLRLFHALGQGEAWATALRQTLDLAGQRLVPDGLRAAPPPVAGSGAAPIG